jgi:hypothetical protein
MSGVAEPARSAVRLVKRRVEDLLLSRPGVVGVDIDEQVTEGRRTGRPAIVVYVRAKLPAADLPPGALVPPQVSGVPTDVVAEQFVLHRALLATDDPPAAVVAGGERHEVLVGGIGVGPCRAVRLVPPDVPRAGDYLVVGTLGVLAVARGRRQVMALTGFHVACVDDAWMVGDRMVHPSRVDGGRCGDEVVATLARAALAGSAAGAALLLQPGQRYLPAIAEVGPVAGRGSARIGGEVRKRGRSTGLTSGVVVSTDATLRLDFGNGLGLRTLRDQIRIRATGNRFGDGAGSSRFGDGAGSSRFGDHGDSGAALVAGGNRVVGLYLGGNPSGSLGFANPIGPVLDQLDVDLLVHPKAADR